MTIGRKPKFNFIPEHQLNADAGSGGVWRVNLMVTSKGKPSLYFPADIVNALDMDGKFMQVFADTEKKAIGWRVVKDRTTLPDLAKSRQLNMNPVSHAIVISVNKIVKALNYEAKKSVRGLLVQRYLSPLISDEINYVVLPEIEEGIIAA